MPRKDTSLLPVLVAQHQNSLRRLQKRGTMLLLRQRVLSYQRKRLRLDCGRITALPKLLTKNSPRANTFERTIMKLALLTTETPHHCLFVEQISTHFVFDMIIVERNVVKPPFPVYHELEGDPTSYEKSLIKSKRYSLNEYSQTIVVDSINDSKVLNVLLANQIDIVVVFGSSFIKSELVTKFAGRIVNLHGGDPERYRGLDSHLWAIYHSDFNSLVTTLHLLDSGLDTGNIIVKWNIDLHEIEGLYQLRARNTLLCARMFVTAMQHYSIFGKFDSYKQGRLGRYYSFMPSEIRGLCVKKFQKYIEGTRK